MMKSVRGRAFQYAVLVCIAAVATLHSCDCGKDTFRQVTYSCELSGGRPSADDTSPCGPSKRFVKGTCEEIRCDAGENPPGCCPGMFCSGGGICELPVRWVQYCDNDGQCDEGQECVEHAYLDPTPGAKTCGFPSVNLAGECDGGGVPFNERCVRKAPCGGSCAPGQVCNIDVTRIVLDLPQGGDCEQPPSLPNVGHGCDQACGEAEILVYADPNQMLFDQCCEVTCLCLTLPPLLSGPWGRFSSLAVGPTNLFVSAYNGFYGDLVMGVHGKLSGQLELLDTIDGVPIGGTVVADPAGPRGGRDGPGPDVGKYTSIALHNGEPRIAYYDVEGGNLKFAAFNGALEAWSVSLVDDGRDSTGVDSGDVGRFTSITIDVDGMAHITYYAHRTTVGATLTTSPMYARAMSTNPLIYEDWERLAIDPVDSCNGLCTDTESCVPDSGTPTCMTTRTDCAPSCDCDEACVDVASQPACRRARPNALREPCDADCPSGFVCVSDSGSGTTCLLDRGGDCGDPTTCTGDEICVDDGATNAICRIETPFSTIAGIPQGVGLFTSLEIYNNKPTVTYYDRLLGQLRAAVADFDFNQAIGSFQSAVIACDPASDVGQHADLEVAPGGATIAVAYQGDGGETLWFKSGADLLVDFPAATAELVDNGARGAQVNLVGGSASLAFDEVTGEPLVAYADQTNNDLMVASRSGGSWSCALLLDDGAYGGFASMAIEGGQAFISNYRRARDNLDRDVSELVIHIVDLSTLPASICSP